MVNLQIGISILFLKVIVHLSCQNASALNCHNVNYTSLFCHNYIPNNLTEGTESVEIVDINPMMTRITNTCFTGNGWSKVKRLKLATVETVYKPDNLVPYLTLYNNTFFNLQSLEYLRLYAPTLIIIKAGAFKGLDNLTELDMPQFKRTSIFYLTQMLENRDAMPNLKVLRIDHMNTMSKPPVKSTSLDRIFFHAIALRNITEIQISQTNFDIVNGTAALVNCDRIKYVDATDSHISRYIDTLSVCKSLETVILSGLRRPNLPRYIRLKDFEYNGSLYNYFYFFENIKVLKLDRLFTENYSSLINTTFTIKSEKLFHIKEISIQNNWLQYLDVIITTEQLITLEKLEVQGNSMQYFNGETFKSTPSLKMLNASKNQFGIMQMFNTTDFEKLLCPLKQLRILDISQNGLTYVPFNTFECNIQLNQLFISGNNIGQLALNSSFSLSLIDLRNNKISNFNEKSRMWFDKVLEFNVNSSTFNVDVAGNPFQCECKYQTFLQWFVQTPFIKSSSKKVTCTYHGKEEITPLLTEQLRETCERPIIIRNIAIASSLGSAFILIITTSAVVALRRRRKRLERKRTLEETIAQIQDGAYRFEFPVFLSHSNEDAETVMRFIYPILVDRLRQILDTPRDLVCIGDRHFRPGRWIYDEILRCLENSAVVIYVISKEFCQSTYCRNELEQGYSMEKPVLLMFLEEVEEEEMTPLMRELFKKYTRIKACYVDGEMHPVPSWEKICSSILDLLPR